MTRKVEPRVIDFGACEGVSGPERSYRDELDAINPNGRYRSPQAGESWVSRTGIRYTLDGDGKLRVTVPDPTPAVERRVRRHLARCKRNPEFPHRPYLFFKHDRVRDVPYPVLKRIYNEEGPSAQG